MELFWVEHIGISHRWYDHSAFVSHASLHRQLTVPCHCSAQNWLLVPCDVTSWVIQTQFWCSWHGSDTTTLSSKGAWERDFILLKEWGRLFLYFLLTFELELTAFFVIIIYLLFLKYNFSSAFVWLGTQHEKEQSSVT